MHVGGLQLFEPPDGATASMCASMFDGRWPSRTRSRRCSCKRARRSISTAGQWGWEDDEQFDIEHHVRHSALPQPGRVRELLALCSRLHCTLLDRQRPLWEMHLIEGLRDGRFAMYFKLHHALVDGVSAHAAAARACSPRTRDRAICPPPWAYAPSQPRPRPRRRRAAPADVPLARRCDRRSTLAAEAAGLPPALVRTLESRR